MSSLAAHKVPYFSAVHEGWGDFCINFQLRVAQFRNSSCDNNLSQVCAAPSWQWLSMVSNGGEPAYGLAPISADYWGGPLWWRRSLEADPSNASTLWGWIKWPQAEQCIIGICFSACGARQWLDTRRRWLSFHLSFLHELWLQIWGRRVCAIRD